MFCPLIAFGQIDPFKRELVQFGYNQSLIGAQPLTGYAFYYNNRPNFLQNSNLTLRLAIAPVYVDSEFGISHALGEYTDVGIGMAGGAYSDNYYEIRKGKYFKEESFKGDSVTPSVSIYHLFDPGRRIPLNGLLRVEFHNAFYIPDENAPNFVLPRNQNEINIRTGFRFGGKQPVLVPDLAMEVSLWYEAQFRLEPNSYGFNDDRHVNSVSQLVWARALMAYTFQNKQNFLVSITTGDSAGTDRFSAYRLGGYLPLAAEFPLNIPGYYYQELSATRFVNLNANYTYPIGPNKRFALTAVASTAWVQYLPGLEQPGHLNSGVGGGLSYHSKSDAWQMVLEYGYGFHAIRDTGRGGQTVGLLVQINLEHTHGQYVVPSTDGGSLHGLNQFMHSLY